MVDFGFEEMQAIQRELQDKYKDKWKKLSPEVGKEKLLWLMVELGEVADVLKKKGVRSIVEEPEVRKDFLEEMCDVLMYYNDVMICYDISIEELKEAYRKKHERNMSRW